VLPKAYTWPNDPQVYGGDATAYRIIFAPGARAFLSRLRVTFRCAASCRPSMGTRANMEERTVRVSLATSRSIKGALCSGWLFPVPPLKIHGPATWELVRVTMG
jgi:hypothetical protein